MDLDNDELKATIKLNTYREYLMDLDNIKLVLEDLPVLDLDFYVKIVNNVKQEYRRVERLLQDAEELSK